MSAEERPFAQPGRRENRSERAWLALAWASMALFVIVGALRALHTLGAAWYVALASCAVLGFARSVRGVVAASSASVSAKGGAHRHKVDAGSLPFV